MDTVSTVRGSGWVIDQHAKAIDFDSTAVTHSLPRTVLTVSRINRRDTEVAKRISFVQRSLSLSEAYNTVSMASKYEFSKGESVRIKVGVFRAFIGKVSEIDKAKGTLKVIVEVFGKSQPVELSFRDVEKISD